MGICREEMEMECLVSYLAKWVCGLGRKEKTPARDVMQVAFFV